MPILSRVCKRRTKGSKLKVPWLCGMSRALQHVVASASSLQRWTSEGAGCERPTSIHLMSAHPPPSGLSQVTFAPTEAVIGALWAEAATDIHPCLLAPCAYLTRGVCRCGPSAALSFLVTGHGLHVWGWNEKLELVFCCELDDVLFQELEQEGGEGGREGTGGAPRRRRRRASRTKRMKGRKWRMVQQRSPKHRGGCRLHRPCP